MREEDLGDGRVNPMIGTALGWGIVTPKQLPYCGAIFLLCLPFIISNPLKGLLIFICAYGFFWILTGNDPTSFIERLKKPKKYISEEPVFNFTKSGFPRPAGSKKAVSTYKIKGKKQTFHHIERKFHFLTYAQIELDSTVGCYVLTRGPQVQLIFAWEVSGHDPSMSHEQAFSIVSNATSFLNQLPGTIDLKCFQEVETSCEDYLKMQASLLLSQDLDPLSIEIVKSRAKRAKKLASQGRLLSNKIIYLAKFRAELGDQYSINQNWIDDLLSKTQPLVGALQGKGFETKESWEKLFFHAYHSAWRKVNDLLTGTNGFGMRVRPLTVQQLWERDYLELHNRPKQGVPLIPQYVVINQQGLQEPVINQYGTHAIGSLFEPQGGYSGVPIFDRHHVYYPIKDKYAGFVRIGQIRRFPKDRQSVPLGYLRYLWNILATDNAPIYDCRVVTELTADRSGFEYLNLDRTISNSVKREAIATTKKTVDVVAMRRRQQAVEARDLLEDNHDPYWVSLGIWLYRDSKQQLDKDMASLTERITSASVERVQNIAEHLWFQTWPFEWEAFLTKPSHRRQKYVSFEALPCLPCIKIKEADKKGMMLVTRELNSPLYIDFANKKNHTLIVAKSGAGKSNLILDILIEYIIYRYMAVLFDFPRPNGTSTFTVLIPLLKKLGVKAAYHNIRDSRINIVELPDLRHVQDQKKLEERLNFVYDNHLSLLTVLVVGAKARESKVDEEVVYSLLSQCYRDFHRDPKIEERYRLAIEGGYGSAAYQEMPILENFVDFAEPWFNAYIEAKGVRHSVYINDTIDIILTKLRAVLETSLGSSINGISSFDTNVEVLVIGLTNVSEDLDSLVYAMSGLNALYRAAFNAKRSLLGIDEGTILFKSDAFARQVGTIPVHGRKWGCNFLGAAQEGETIRNCCSGSDIIKNLDNVFCGHILEAALAEMTHDTFGMKRDILTNYTTDSFMPSSALLQSYWYLKRGGQHLEVTHPPSELTLALGATDLDEDAARQRTMDQFPDDEVRGVLEFAKLNAKAKQQGLPMETIYPDSTHEYNQA